MPSNWAPGTRETGAAAAQRAGQGAVEHGRALGPGRTRDALEQLTELAGSFPKLRDP